MDSQVIIARWWTRRKFVTEVNLTIDVVREEFVKHGARLTRLHIHHHLLVPILLVHLCDGFVPLLGRELNSKDFARE